VAATESVYVGASDSVAVYPAIASVFPGEFDDDLAFSRDGGLGLRWVPQSSFELGALIRFQTLGFKSSDAPELSGLPDRPSTLEIGPTVGWRGWPVDVDYTAFADLLRHHSGASHVLRFSLPKRWERSFDTEIALRLRRRLRRHYFGVPSAAATLMAGVRQRRTTAGPRRFVGLQLRPRWLSAARCDGSGWHRRWSIVDSERRAYVSLQATGNRCSSMTPAAGPETERWPIATVTLTEPHRRARVAHVIRRGRERRRPPVAPAYLDARVRVAGHIGPRSSVGTASRDSSATGAELDDWRASYAYAVLDDPQKVVTIDGGVHVMRLDLELAGAPGADSTRRSSPLPAIGVSAEAHFRRKLAVNAQLRWFMFDLDPRSGRRLFISVGMTHRTFARAAFGFGYVFDRLSLDFDDAGVTGALDLDYHGPSLTLTGYF
jgi:hypothetical protein